MTPSPFLPEPTERLAARFTAALDRVWAPDDSEDAPGRHREHVFDFDCGARLIAAVWDFGQPGLGLQLVVSVSWVVNRPYQVRLEVASVALLASLGMTTFVPSSVRRSPEGVLFLYAPWAPGAAAHAGPLRCLLCGRRQTPTDTGSGWIVWTLAANRRYHTCPAEYAPRDAARTRLRERVDHAAACHERGPVTMPAVGRSAAESRRPGVN